MNIKEAIENTTEDKPYITREMWNGERGLWRGLDIKILPTNTPECCMVESATLSAPRSRWNPNKDDLTADDWTITG